MANLFLLSKSSNSLENGGGVSIFQFLIRFCTTKSGTVGTFMYSFALFVFGHIIFEISKYGGVCTNQDNPTIYGFLKTRVGRRRKVHFWNSYPKEFQVRKNIFSKGAYGVHWKSCFLMLI